MRQSELVNIQWKNIDLTRRTVFLPNTKNGDTRTVPLSTAALGVLTALPGDHSGDVFPGVTAQAIKKAFIRAVRNAGIDDFHFHDLRHEAASRKLEAGYPMHAVSLWLGHRSLTTTARYLNADIGQLHALNDRPGPAVAGVPRSAPSAPAPAP